jgi:hypothetical protein
MALSLAQGPLDLDRRHDPPICFAGFEIAVGLGDLAGREGRVDGSVEKSKIPVTDRNYIIITI